MGKTCQLSYLGFVRFVCHLKVLIPRLIKWLLIGFNGVSGAFRLGFFRASSVAVFIVTYIPDAGFKCLLMGRSAASIYLYELSLSGDCWPFGRLLASRRHSSNLVVRGLDQVFRNNKSKKE